MYVLVVFSIHVQTSKISAANALFLTAQDAIVAAIAYAFFILDYLADFAFYADCRSDWVFYFDTFLAYNVYFFPFYHNSFVLSV